MPVPAPRPEAGDLDQVHIDGIWLHHDRVLLIARGTAGVIGRQWAAGESTAAHRALPSPIPAPRATTTDGAPGALKAIATTWPDTKVQRCPIHVRRDTVRDPTLHPRTAQGRAPLGLPRKPLTITTTDRAAHRPAALNDYATEYRTWLNQRTTAQDDPATAAATGRKRWYTHPRTRQPADPQQILTAWHAQGRPPRRRIPTVPTSTSTRPPVWGTTPTPEEGLWTRKGWAGRTH